MKRNLAATACMALIMSVLIPGLAQAEAPTVYAGGYGSGPAYNISTPPGALAAHNGAVYFVDAAYGVIRKLDVSGPGIGTISNLAGGGYWASDLISVLRQPESPNEDQADFAWVNGLDIVADGTIYLADEYQDVIYRVTPDGDATVVAGNRAIRGATDAAGNPQGVNDSLRAIGPTGEGTPATKTRIYDPQDLAVDAEGNIFFTEWGQSRVRRVDAADGTISTVYGLKAIDGCERPRSAGLPVNEVPGCEIGYPWGIDVAPNGDLVVADTYNDRVVRVTPAGGIDVIADDLLFPQDVALGGDGTVYITGALEGWGMAQILAVHSDGSSEQLVRSSEVSLFTHLTVEEGRLFAIGSDSDYKEFLLEIADGHATAIAGSWNNRPRGDGGALTDAQLAPGDMAVGPNSELVILDATYRPARIRRVDCTGTLSTIATADEYFAVGVGPDGSVYTSGSDGLTHYSPGGAVTPVESYAVGLPEDAAIEALAVDHRGNLIMSDKWNDRVLMLAPNGDVTTLLEGGGIERDVSVSVNSGGYEVTLGSQAAYDGQGVREPAGIFIDPDDGQMYIADTGNDRLIRLTPTEEGYEFAGRVVTTEGTPNRPIDVAQTEEGNLLFLEEYGAVQEITPNQGMTEYGWATSIEYPQTLASADGNVLIGDFFQVHQIAGAAPLGSNCETTLQPTSLIYSGSTVGRGATVDLAATLLDAGGSPLEGLPVRFTVNDQVLTTVTDGDGIARTTLTVTAHGKSLPVTAAFAGDGTLAPATTAATIYWGNPGKPE